MCNILSIFLAIGIGPLSISIFLASGENEPGDLPLGYF
jgi:hypothetical protein